MPFCNAIFHDDAYFNEWIQELAGVPGSINVHDFFVFLNSKCVASINFKSRLEWLKGYFEAAPNIAKAKIQSSPLIPTAQY